MPKRVELAFDRWVKGDSKGKGSGQPRFKIKSQYKTFTYAQFKQHYLFDNQVKLSKIGDVKVIVHRLIPDGFAIKTVSFTKKAVGYYVTFSWKYQTVSTIKPELKRGNIVAIDVGLIDFFVTSDNQSVVASKYLRKSVREALRSKGKLKSAQRKVSRRNIGSKPRAKAVKQLANKHKKSSWC